MDKHLIEQGMALILKGLNVPTDDHNFKDTPGRYAKMLEEIFGAPDTATPVFEENYTDVVILRGHTFFTMCPHHMALVTLRAAVCYIPSGAVIGASKLMRLMGDVNRFPMTQEMLTARILERILELTANGNNGAGVFLEGNHDCFRSRGVKSPSASMITFKFAGEMKNVENQRMFLDLVRQR